MQEPSSNWCGSPHGAGSDQIAIQRAIEKYEDIDLQFAGSREGNLLRVRPSSRTSFSH